ncbi:uncharacterized protein SCHCODRAFT_02503433 [Schizophyllum commune H4-8]|uniref:Uncharacterized protein n=1 Tax=Schizophyllum commune (strain H4-8 / FGSC 9210) TaxID=578458 RepID=D8Q5Q4_SCHCM|nr:uncharacterized protein SCHCODRAFT_02503433 [Schizophyllum commune H4-8]KAI5892078.1 hypothetical protein SCHCODRAFT_02503433 [Schizophyllum commune H4-8]
MAPFFAFISLALAFIVNATPTPERRLTHVPREATKLAADPETGTIYLFNSRDEHLGILDHDAASSFQRRAGGCADISADEVQQLPGWSKLKDQANSMWGDYQREIKTNNPDSQSIGGSVVGTNGTVMLSQTEGTSYTLETSTTRQASVALDLSAEAKLGIPDIAEVTFKTSVTTTVSNTLGKTESATSNQQTTSTVTAQQKDGQTCQLDFETKTCTTKGSGQMPFIASGWVWFVYKNKTKDHWNWALLMEGYLDESERSTYMSFDSNIGTETKSQYNVVCQ